MPILIKDVDESFKAALQQKGSYRWMQSVFNDFVGYTTDIFSPADPCRLNLDVTSEVADDGASFTLKFCGKQVKFSFIPSVGAVDHHAVLVVHLLPTLPDFEAPILLRTINVQGSGETNLEIQGQAGSLKDREHILAFCLDCLVTANSFGFCEK